MTKILHVLFRVKYSSAVERTLPADVQNLELWSRKKKPHLSSTICTIDQKPGEKQKHISNQKQSRERNCVKNINKNSKKNNKKKKSLREMSFTNVKSN